MNREEFIDHLNEDLMSEFSSILQYVQHIATIKGAPYQQTLEELTVHLNQELEHALLLARQIDFLGGVPTAQVGAIPVIKDPEMALRQDLNLEETQLRRYRERVTQADELGLPDVAEALSPLLEQTQDHVRDLRAAIG